MSATRKSILALTVTAALIICILLVTLPTNARCTALQSEYDDLERRLMVARAMENGITAAQARIDALKYKYGDDIARMDAGAGAPEIVAELSALMDAHRIDYGGMQLSGSLSELSGAEGAPGVRELVILVDVTAASADVAAFCTALEHDAAHLLRIRALSLAMRGDVMSGVVTVCCYVVG